MYNYGMSPSDTLILRGNVFMKISIDAGHNCTPDVGATGLIQEDTLTKEVVAKVIFKFQSQGHEVLDVTPYGQTFNTETESLAYRVDNANAFGSALHLCIHANVYDTTAYGSECWIYAPGGQSQTYATAILNEICTAIGTTNRGVKSDPDLYVPKNTNMPCVLVEALFIDNAGDMAKYDSDKIANAIVKGITGVSPSLSAPNCKVVNDFLYKRDVNGNLIGGQIDIGDYIQVLAIDYTNQRIKLKHSTPTGLETVYATNAVNCLQYTYQDKWHNGSTAETVYSDPACTVVYGSLDPYEYATPITRESTHLQVVYDTAQGNNKKAGYVKYNGGFTTF